MSNSFPVPQDVQDNPYFWQHVGTENVLTAGNGKRQTAINVWHMEYHGMQQQFVCEVCGGNAWWRPTVGTYWCIDGGHPARARQNRSAS